MPSLFDLYDTPPTPPYGTDENGNRVMPTTGINWNNPYGASNVGGTTDPIQRWRYANNLPLQIQPTQRTIQGPSSQSFQKQQVMNLAVWDRIGNTPSPSKPKTVPQGQYEQRIAGQYSQTNAQNQNYSLLRAQANMTPQQKQNQAYGEQRKYYNRVTRPQSVSAMYIRGNALQKAIDSVNQRNFWSNAYQQLNAALRPVNIPLTTPQSSGGGGYGYPYYGYGGGGYKPKPYAENLPGAKWMMNQ